MFGLCLLQAGAVLEVATYAFGRAKAACPK
jgi:hypothetical protein